jgi:dTDP-4-amino-4,6-dideoxygalactose transaminase
VAIDGGASFEAVTADPGRFLGDIPVALSFHATKSFSTAEGGCVVTTDIECARRAGQALNFGFFDTRDCHAASLNGKMSEYHAAVGLAELDGWEAKRAALQSVAEAYRRQFDQAGLGSLLDVAPSVASCYALLRCRDSVDVEHIVRALNRANIESRSWYGHGLHRQPYYANVTKGDLSVTDRDAPLVVGLPVAPDLAKSDIDRIAKAVEFGHRHYQRPPLP